MFIMSNLRIASFNCGGFNPRRGLDSVMNSKVNEIQKTCDILLLQETWLTKQETRLLATAIPEFVGIGESTTDAASGPIKGHPKGGVALFWRREISNIVKPLFFNIDWATGITITVNDVIVYVICVYLPCCSNDNEDEFLLKMGELISLVNDLDSPNVLIIGDFNADIARGTMFGKHLKSICDDNDLICSTIKNLPGDSFTHISYAWHTRSWLDHCITTSGGDNLLKNFKICYDVSDRDHLPIKFDLEIGENVPKIIYGKQSVKSAINWSNISINKKGEYRFKLEAAMVNILKMLDEFCCSGMECCDQKHLDEILKLYDKAIHLIRGVGDDTLGNKRNKYKRRPMPGWSEFVDKHHKHSIICYHAWKTNGCPATGQLYDQMKLSHEEYKRAVHYVKKNEDNIRKEKLANKLFSNNSKSFWNDVRKNSEVKILSSSIEGCNNEQDICSLWKDHYDDLLNTVGNSVPINMPNVREDFEPVTVSEVIDCLRAVKLGKSAGPDGLTIENLIYSGEITLQVITKFFNLFIEHNFLPDVLMKTCISPVIKDVKKDISAKNNYRPIAIATAISKLFELVLKGRIESSIEITANQFGFRKQSGTEFSIHAMKEIMHALEKKYQRGYICMLDASKAFDRVNHSKLFNKLLECGVQPYLVKILLTWYSNQEHYVRWGNSRSESFRCTNGIKQGGLLSPLLFSLYLNDLSNSLNKEHIGCMIGGMRVNHVMYADDVALVSPSFSGMQRLVEVCADAAQKDDLVFNPAKSNLLILGNKAKSGISHTLRLNNETVAEVQQTRYLGVILRNDNKDDEDIMRVCRYVYAFGNSLIKGFGNCSKSVKTRLFQTYMYQLYGLSSWGRFKCATLQKLRVAYNTMFRKLMKVPRFHEGVNYSASGTFVSNNTHSFQERMRKSMFSLMSRLSLSDNPIIKALVHYSDTPGNSTIHKTWKNFLYVRNLQ